LIRVGPTIFLGYVMIEAKELSVIQHEVEGTDKLRTKVVVDVEHNGAHDLFVDVFLDHVATVVKEVDNRCQHLPAYAPRSGSDNEPRQWYCILCGKKPLFGLGDEQQ